MQLYCMAIASCAEGAEAVCLGCSGWQHSHTEQVKSQYLYWEQYRLFNVVFNCVQAADTAPFANVCTVLLPLLSTSLVLVPHEIHRETLDTSILCCPITITGLLSQIVPAHKLFWNIACHNCFRMSSTNWTRCCAANISSSSLRIVLGQLTWRSQSSGYMCLKKEQETKTWYFWLFVGRIYYKGMCRDCRT